MYRCHDMCRSFWPVVYHNTVPVLLSTGALFWCLCQISSANQLLVMYVFR